MVRLAEARGLRSIVLCKGCLTCLESKFPHDSQECPCPNNTFVDGGPAVEARRYGGVDWTLIEVIE